MWEDLDLKREMVEREVVDGEREVGETGAELHKGNMKGKEGQRHPLFVSHLLLWE